MEKEEWEKEFEELWRYAVSRDPNKIFTGHISMLEFIRRLLKSERELTQITPTGKDELYCEWFVCDKCQNKNITSSYNYCPGCGRKIDKV